MSQQLILPSYRRDDEVHPPLDSPDYRSTALRHPKRPLRPLLHTLTEITGPVLGEGRLGELEGLRLASEPFRKFMAANLRVRTCSYSSTSRTCPRPPSPIRRRGAR